MNFLLEFLQIADGKPALSALYIPSYRPELIGLSLVIAVLVSYAAVTTSARGEFAATARQRNGWRLLSATLMGLGVWSMHFFGMLALDLPCGIGYDRWLTIASVLPGIAASGVALNIATKGNASR